MTSPPFRGFHALAVDDGEGWAGFLADQFAGLFIESVVQAAQRPIAVPTDEVVVNGRARRQVARERPPLASRLKDVEDGVDHLTQVDPAATARADLRNIDMGADERPLRVGQITGVARVAPLIDLSVLRLPHRRLHRIGGIHGITSDSTSSTFFRTGSESSGYF